MCCANLADAVVEWKSVSVHVEAGQDRVIERALKCGEHGNLEVANQPRPVRAGFHERGQNEALAHVVVAPVSPKLKALRAKLARVSEVRLGVKIWKRFA
jgi:hypothetical protein